MIDIHPPHHAATTRRDFFIHLATVVLGILFAIDRVPHSCGFIA